MSPHGRGSGLDGRGFPRVSGDEPRQSINALTEPVFSPRERG